MQLLALLMRARAHGPVRPSAPNTHHMSCVPLLQLACASLPRLFAFAAAFACRDAAIVHMFSRHLENVTDRYPDALKSVLDAVTDPNDPLTLSITSCILGVCLCLCDVVSAWTLSLALRLTHMRAHMCNANYCCPPQMQRLWL